MFKNIKKIKFLSVLLVLMVFVSVGCNKQNSSIGNKHIVFDPYLLIEYENNKPSCKFDAQGNLWINTGSLSGPGEGITIIYAKDKRKEHYDVCGFAGAYGGHVDNYEIDKNGQREKETVRDFGELGKVAKKVTDIIEQYRNMNDYYSSGNNEGEESLDDTNNSTSNFGCKRKSDENNKNENVGFGCSRKSDVEDIDINSNVSNEGENYSFYSNPNLENISRIRYMGDYSTETTYDQMDTITFGNCIQSASGQSATPIEWVVLERSGDKALIMSKLIIENCVYSMDGSNNWNNSYIRTYINDLCYNSWFNDEEKKYIIRDSNGDNLSLLDENLCRKYFGYEDSNGYNKRIATHLTDYMKSMAKERNITIGSKNGTWYKGNSSFWLKTPVNNGNVEYIGLYGRLNTDGDIVSKNDGIRPIMWVKIN